MMPFPWGRAPGIPSMTDPAPWPRVKDIVADDIRAGEVIRRLVRLWEQRTPEEMQNHVEFL